MFYNSSFRLFVSLCFYDSNLGCNLDKSSLGSPQMNEVAQRASVAEGLPAVLIVGVAADGDREGPLAQEGLVSSWHGS